MTYVQMGEYLIALPYLEKALEIRENTISSPLATLADAHGNLAQVLLNLHRYSEAAQHAKRAFDITNVTIDPNNRPV
jgi:tetratricopeptide (TPR) repeat protein